MEISLILLSKLTSMMLMAVVGYIVVRVGALRQEDSRVISSLLVYVLQPCMIIRCFMIDLTPERLRGFVSAMIFGFAAQFLWIFLTRVLRGPLHLRAVDRSTLIYSNCGNLILPLVSMTLGDDMIFYCSAYMVSFNLLFWSHGYSMIRGDKGINLKKLIKNPTLIAVVIGLILMLTGIRLPTVIDSALEGFQNMVAASSMMLVGMVLATSNLRTVFLNRRAYLITLGRLLLLPTLTLLLLYATGFLHRNPDLVPAFMVSTLAVSAPSASSNVQLAVLYDKDPLDASIYNVMTTVFCMFSMPVMLLLFQTLFV